jgi:hypothetical protein
MKTPLQLLFEEVGVDADTDRARHYLDLEKEAIIVAWIEGKENTTEGMQPLDYYLSTYGQNKE